MRRACTASLAGALVVGLVARHYGLDHPDPIAPAPLAQDLSWAALYAVGVALLAIGWLGVMRAARSLRLVIALGILVHAAALVGAPFLSRDPLAYAAIGRVPAGVAPAQALPPDDALIARLAPGVRNSPSVYGRGFDALAHAIARVAGDDLPRTLCLQQLVAGAAILAAGALTGLAAGPGAAALVIFSPLAVIEATQSAHNDALLALTVALFVLRTPRRGATTALAAGLLIKLSAGLLLGLHLGRAVVQRLPRAALVALAGVAAVLGVAFASHVPSVGALVGSPDVPFDYCTRSIECLPRVILRWGFGWPTAAFVVGLVFRALAAAWLGWTVLRAARSDDERPSWASGLFIYYLFLHAWAQSWYLLSLLPLVPWATPRLRPAMLTACVSAVAYYAIAIPFEHATAPAALLVRDVLGGAATILPPAVVLVRAWRDGTRASRPASPPTRPGGR